MRARITAMTMAAIIAAVIGAGPSFGQGMSPAGSAPPAAAPSGGGGAAMGGGRAGGGAPQNAGPRGGNRGGGIVGGGNFQRRGGQAPIVGGGGGPNRQAWRDGRNHRGGYHRGYRGGYGGGVVFGATPYWGGSYAYDDDNYYAEPAPAGGDVAYCIQRFKSYDPDSGTYLGFDGRRHACP